MENRKGINEMLGNDDSNPLDLALANSLADILKMFEKKDIISRNYAKTYALIGNTNKVQKEMINEIIAKQNDSKGRVKKMYLKIIYYITNAIKENKDSTTEKESKFGRILRRY